MNMADDFEEKFIKPIINASYPGTLAGLALAVLTIGVMPWFLRVVLTTAAFTFLLSAFFIFFYSIYPARKRLWTLAAIAFLFGLSCSILAAVLLFVVS
jgi:uncharacterized membrane protein